MRFLDDIILFLTAACEAGSSALASAAARTIRNTCLMAGLLVVALVLLLGAVGLMVTALFLALAPDLGAQWAAMIAAGASLAGAGLFLAIAFKVSKSR